MRVDRLPDVEGIRFRQAPSSPATIPERLRRPTLDLAEVLAPELGQAGQAAQGVESAATDQEVAASPIATDLANDRDVIEQAHLGDPVVGRRHPLVRAVLTSEQAKVLFVQVSSSRPS